MHRILGIGELLWDVLPKGPKLGGAPANFSVMAGRLGNSSAIISRIGEDELGKEALRFLETFPVDCSQIQTDPEQPTGRVTVELEQGQPSYTIHHPVAWDFMEATPEWTAQAAAADAICFGSLAQRSEHSRTAIQTLVRATRPGCQRIFDVNLRAPFYNELTVRSSLQLASVMKMNDLEVPLVLDLLGMAVSDTLLAGAMQLLDTFDNLQMVAITCGGAGSLLVKRDEYHQHPGVPVTVADTIGAGDAFTAGMTTYLLRGAPLATLNEAGNRWGSFIASQPGAMPEIPVETLREITGLIESAT